MTRNTSSIWATRLAAVESPGVTTLAPNWPIFWESASGSLVTDSDNQQYIDMTAAFGVMNIGHANPTVTAAISNQAAKCFSKTDVKCSVMTSASSWTDNN